jgi:hypothetical protein
MAFVSPRPGVRLACTATHFGRECGSHIVLEARSWWCPTCGQARDASEVREDISTRDLAAQEAA